MRKCYNCGQPNGKGARELRPYGPGGQDICAECCFSDPAKIEEFKRQYHALLDAAQNESPVGGAIIGGADGPVPLADRKGKPN